jgi:hypothetical protein
MDISYSLKNTEGIPMRTTRITAICTTVLFFAGLSLSWGQVTIAEKEIRKIKEAKFTNYTGEVKNPDRVVDMIAVGRTLATNLKSGGAAVGEKYSLTRVLSSNASLYSADIFGVGPAAKVNHVKNLRRIMSGYIGSSFKINPKLSMTIATFITYYNAWLRTHPEGLDSYAAEVVKALDPAKAGIGLNYREWPGASQLLVPLSVSGLYGSNISTRELYNKAEEALKNQPDRGVQDRQEMLNARQDELANRQKTLDQKIDQNQARQEKVQGEIRNVEKSEPSTDRNARLENAAAKQDELKKQEQQLLAEKDKLIAEKTELQQKQEELKKDIKFVNYSGVETEKYLYFMKFDRIAGGVIYKELSAINKADLYVERKYKDVTSMNTSIVDGKNVLSVALNPATQKFGLTVFDGETLDIVDQSQQAVYANSYVDEDRGFFYAVVEKDKAFHLGKFDSSLKLVQKTDTPVFQNSGIIVSSDKIFLLTTSADGKTRNISVFNKEDLKFIKNCEQK